MSDAGTIDEAVEAMRRVARLGRDALEPRKEVAQKTLAALAALQTDVMAAIRKEVPDIAGNDELDVLVVAMFLGAAIAVADKSEGAHALPPSEPFQRSFEKAYPDDNLHCRDCAQAGWDLAMQYAATFFYGAIEADRSIALMFNQRTSESAAGELTLELLRCGMGVPGLPPDFFIAPKDPGK